MNDGLRVVAHARWIVLDEDDPMPGWRYRIAFALRRLARRIDGTSWHTVLCESSTDLAAPDAARCLRAGLAHGGRLWAELAAERAVDLVMPVVHPELYEAADE